ncbi:MAG: siderophore-interacting protein [Azoarcus sp.]|jgi:NADPH-dependent ferric siderophore reductase|nr:siderophore-interacting protein [Azoarcus sp.]
MIPELLRRLTRTINAVVIDAWQITPRVRRLALGGPEVVVWLGSEGVAAPAAWVKLTPPGCGGRGYTIRALDRAAGVLQIDFALHVDEHGQDCGTVAGWARTARPGDVVSLSGPRGGFALQPDARWVWLAADATALPAVQTILAALPQGMPVFALIVVHDENEHQDITTAAQLQTLWRYQLEPAHILREDDPVRRAIATLRGPGQVCMAGEADWVRSWKQYWMQQRQLEIVRVNGKGYWKVGARGHRG